TPKLELWVRSGAKIWRICWRASVKSITGNSPTVVPLFGSVAISGMGMKGEVRGSNQCARLSQRGRSTASACTELLSRASAIRQTLHRTSLFTSPPNRLVFRAEIEFCRNLHLSETVWRSLHRLVQGREE